MKKMVFHSLVLVFLCFVGCSSSDSNTTTNSGNDDPFKGRLAVFKDWSSADGPTRLAIIEDNIDEENGLEWLDVHLRGAKIEQLKQLLGEPDFAEEQTRMIVEKPRKYLFYFYYLGTTTRETPVEEQEVIELRIESGRVSKLKLKRNSDA